MALLNVNHPDPIRVHAAIERGLTWMLSMQNDDGGWARSIGTTIRQS